MGREYKQISTVFQHTPVPAYLCEQICQAVLHERMRHERLRFVVSSLCGTSSFVGLVFALPALIRAASDTGFMSYSHLLLTDSDLVSAHMSTFVVPVLEALPGIQVILTLFLLSVFLVSFYNFVRSFSYRPFSFTSRTLTHA